MLISCLKNSIGDGFSIHFSEDFDNCIEVVCKRFGVPHLFILCSTELEQLQSFNSISGLFVYANKKQLSPLQLESRLNQNFKHDETP